MDNKNSWIQKVKSELQKSPLASNVLFGFILTGLEKLVEVEFACPCQPKWNAVFASAFFCVPVFLVSLLMINIHGCECEKLFSSFVPALLWIILLFMDGHYFACAMTSWSGRFVSVDNGVPQKWCEPANHTKQASSEDLMMKTQLWFTLSQGIGIVLIILLTVAIGVYWKCCREEEQGGNYTPARNNNQDAEARV